MNGDTSNVEMPDSMMAQNDHPDDSDDGAETDNDLEGIGHSATELININTKYQPEWGGREAFREFYQNFKDGILSSFDITTRDFKPKIEESEKQILIQVFHPTKWQSPDKDRVLCGFIRFQFDADNKGVLEFTNFKAALQRWHLGFGGTSKANEVGQAGQHGEGMKLAALIMRRNPRHHTVRIHASKFSWSFGFSKKKMLSCTLTRINENKITEAKAQDRKRRKEKLPRDLQAHAWEDVSVVIGESRSCRTIAGEVKRSSKIPLNDFREWLNMTIDIYPPTEVVQTSNGDIILDKAFQNKVYLQGLLLPKCLSAKVQYQYGYNFHFGKTGRDRDYFSATDEAAQQMTTIWSEAIRIEAQKGATDLLLRYTQLLEEEEWVSPDTYTAGIYLRRDIVQLLYTYLKQSALSGSTMVPFFYAKTESKWRDVIRESLKREPKLINRRLWNIFLRHGFCRPFESIWNSGLEQAETIQAATPFGLNIEHALRAFIESLPNSVKTDLRFYESHKMDLGVSERAGAWAMDAKFLSFNTWHHDSSKCFVTQYRRCDLDSVFECEHVLLHIFDLILSRADLKDPQLLGPQNRHLYASREIAKLRKMPQDIRIVSDGRLGGLMVTWTFPSQSREEDIGIRVKLHSSLCHELEALQSTSTYEVDKRRCNCPSNISEPGSTTVNFTDLNPQGTYTAKCSQDINGAYFGRSPAACCPSDPSLRHLPPASQATSHDKGKSKAKTLDESVSDAFAVSQAVPTTEDNTASGEDPRTTNSSQFQPLKSNDLPWESGFPSAYEWVQKTDHGNRKVFIARSKAGLQQGDKKRGAEDDELATQGKKARS